MNNDYYIIDDQLDAYPMKALMMKKNWQGRETFGENFWKGGVAQEEALPLAPYGKLQPGELYESSADPNTRFYLPQYTLNVVDGRYTTRLKWRGPGDNPNGPLAFLTIDLQPVAPQSQGFNLVEIPHQAVARLVYQPLVQADASGDVLPAGGDQEGDVAGERPALSLEVGALERVGQNLSRCVLPVHEKEGFDRIYQILTDSAFNSRLEVRCFATAGRRTWNQIVIGDLIWESQKTALTDYKVLYTYMLDEEVVVEPPEDSWSSKRNIFLDDVPDKRLNRDEALVMLKPNPDTLAATAPEIQPLDNPTGAGVSEIASFPAETHRIDNPAPAELFMEPRPEVELSPSINLDETMPSLEKPHLDQPILDKPITSLPGANEVFYEPSLEYAFKPPLNEALSNSDLVLEIAGAQQAAVPLVSFLDDRGKPALIKFSVETRQEIRPFWFSIQTNAYIFDIPGDLQPGTNHVLIRRSVLDSSGQVLGVYYQDSAFREQCYYQPQEFRIPRQDEPPYLPNLRVAFFEVATQPAEGAAELYYRVEMAYRAVPYIEPHILDLARQQAGSQAEFTALSPENSRLVLRLPEDEAEGALTPVAREQAEVRFDQGIVDEVQLSLSEFQRIFSFFQSASGVDGDIEAELLDRQMATIPVKLSLKHNAGQVFSLTDKGVQENGLRRVALYNRIESPVRIEGLYRVPLGGGAFAYPQSGSGQVVQPGQVVEIDYRLEGSGAAESVIQPVVGFSIQVDPRSLWPQLMINEGYRSNTFPLTVSIAPDYFESQEGAEALTGVRVEFGKQKQVILSPGHLSEEVVLRMPLLPFLLGDAQAKQFRYRVVNLHGPVEGRRDGKESDWITRQGDAPLDVQPVPL